MMKKKQLINEIMGVPRVLTPWVNSFYEIITNAVNSELKSGWDYDGELKYVNPDTNTEEITIVKKIDTIYISGEEVMNLLVEINNYSDMKDFLKSEMFKGLPLWRPSITITDTMGVPNDVFNIETGPSVSASINADLTQGLSKIGKVPVLPNIKFGFDLLMPLDDKNIKFDSDLKAAISHELLHSYQKLKQLESGKPSHFGKEGILNILPNIEQMSGIEIEDWKSFLHLVYVHLSFEINARVTEIYYTLEELGVDNTEDFLKEIKKTGVWRQMKMLKEFDAEKFIKNFEIPNAKIKFGTKNPLAVLHDMISSLSIKTNLKKRGLDVSSNDNMLKSIIKLWDILLQAGNERLKQDIGVDFNMLPVPDSAKKDPYLFFKFFEKRFHKKAEKWEKKLYRIASLLTQKEKIGENILKEERVINFNKPNNNFVLIAGGPGVGKSFITNNLINLNNVKLFNVDQVRVMTAKKLWGDKWSENMSTPEGYQKILDLTYTTSDPRNLTVKFLKNFLQQERKEGANVLYDAGGGQKGVMEEILEIAKNNGFHTTLIYVRTPLEISQERNAERPRSLPPEMVSNYHKKVKDNIRLLIDRFDSVWFVDNKDLIDISDRPTENIEQIK